MDAWMEIELLFIKVFHKKYLTKAFETIVSNFSVQNDAFESLSVRRWLISKKCKSFCACLDLVMHDSNVQNGKNILPEIKNTHE